MLVALVVATFVLAGCVPTGERPELVGDAVDAAPAPGDALSCPAPGEPFEAFGSTVIRLAHEQGTLERCVLVADTIELRARGLMEVDDLAVYDGMIFAFPDDTTGGFWMGNTTIPLSIAYIADNGAVVSVMDMEPCPEAVDCPSYVPDAPYRWALEVPQGQLGGFGVSPGSLFAVESLPVTTQ